MKETMGDSGELQALLIYYLIYLKVSATATNNQGLD